MPDLKHWNVFVRSGAAGGKDREATVNLTVQTLSDTVEEVRATVESLPMLAEALEAALPGLQAIAPSGVTYEPRDLVIAALNKVRGEK